MKILIHTDEYYPTPAACAYRMKVFADTFAELGHEVTVVASSTNRESGAAHGCRERIIHAPAIRLKRKTTVMRMLNNLSFAFTSVFAAMKAGRADVVITTSPPPLVSISGWLIAKMKGAMLVYDVRDIWPEVALEMNSFTEDSLFCKVFRKITDFMYRHADMVTTVSDGKIEKIRAKLPAEMRDKVQLVGNGFDESVLSQGIDGDIIDTYGLDDRFTCVYIGNIGLAQGLDAVLKLAEHARGTGAQFLLFGRGADRERLEVEAREKGLDNVRFCGEIAHSKVRTLLTGANMCIIPLRSANMRDSIPSKLYEALGVGCPVLLVAEGDSCRLVEESGMGVCVSPDRPEQLSGAFDVMFARDGEYAAMRRDVGEMIKRKYSRQKIAADFEKLLRRSLEERKGKK